MLLISLVSASAAAQVCDVVRVEFNGCAEAKIPNEIDVNVGDEVVTVRKQPDGAWEGHARDPFKLSQRMLTVDLPAVRTTCHVAARPQAIDAGASCRAVFNVRCEQLWSLRVSNTVKKKTPLSYRCETAANAIRACDDDAVPTAANIALVAESPLTIQPVGVSQGVILGVTAADGTAIEYIVKEKTLRKLGKTVKLSALPPRPAVQSAGGSNPFLSALKTQQALAFEHIVLTWDTP